MAGLKLSSKLLPKPLDTGVCLVYSTVMETVIVVWAPTRSEAVRKARRAGVKVGRVTLIPDNTRWEAIKAWMINPR
jgi:hypothetical protein